MCTKSELQKITSVMAARYKEVFGEKLKQVILYGSYARGDYDNESDIDIVGIVDCPREELSGYMRSVVKTASDLDLEYGVMVSPSAIPYKDFMTYKDDLPYYRNIHNEGVVLSA